MYSLKSQSKIILLNFVALMYIREGGNYSSISKLSIFSLKVMYDFDFTPPEV